MRDVMFNFLNIQDIFSSWNMTEHGMLWAYNLNYMDWLGQEGMSQEKGEEWIDRFIADLPSNRIGLDPYPIALRSINWIKFFSRHPQSITKERLDSLYSQVLLLEKKLEYHLLGNHLLEDAYALFFASVFFQDERLFNKTAKLLTGQLKEQVLSDGAHYEQSPMYHCIMLDRLMDCYNISLNNECFEEQRHINQFLRRIAEKMLGHLMSIVWKDGSIPLLNDSAYGIAPSCQQLLDYADRLGLSYQALKLGECGYRKMNSNHLEVILDVGNVAAVYQPGHTHADTFSYELRLDGEPFIVDTGISTYDKTPRRQYERSTVAHNTVVVNGKDSSHVWGGFRVGKRCKVTLQKDTEAEVIASHDGYGKPCQRRFAMKDGAFVVDDIYDGEAVSLIHLAAHSDMNRIHIDGATDVRVEERKYSVEYNRFIDCKTMEIHFNGKLRYTIQ